MDKNYTKALNIAEDTLHKMNNIYDNAKTDTFEDVKGCKAIEEFVSNIEDFIRIIKHYSKPTQEGYLELKPNSRYSLASIELSCGYPVEIYNIKSHTWNDGVIQHSDKYGGYYFYNYDDKHMGLSDGVKARVRV